MTARIVAVNRFYRPDHSATSQLLTDLLERCAAEGADVRVITSRMLYDDPSRRLEPIADQSGVRTIRVPTTRFGRDGLMGRALDCLTFHLATFLTLLRELRRGDTVLALTDPPLISIICALASSIKGARLVNWCQDLFPEVATALAGRHSLMSLAEFALLPARDLSLHAAGTNIALNDGMARRLRTRGVAPERIEVVHNWATESIRPIAAEHNPLRREWGLEGRFVIGYSGNLGRAHAAERVRALVAATVAEADLTFLFIGGGGGLETLRELAEDLDPAQLQFRPYQPREQLSSSLSVPDLHLVALDPACEGLIMPSKIYGAVAAGRPVALLGDPSGPTAQAIEEFGLGTTLPIDDLDRSAGKLVELASAPWLLPGTDSLRRVHEERLAAANALRDWQRILLSSPPPQPSQPRPVPA